MPPPESWCPPQGVPVLLRDEIHVWRAWLDLAPDQLARLADTLAPDERARGSRFRFPRDRRHFIAARGILRDILARYTGLDPAGLRFRYGPAGKPALFPDSGSNDPRFNVSHSHGLALYSLARGRETGVDVERIQPRIAPELIAERFFSARETQALLSLPHTARSEAFFNCWTRKEAYVKARGEGLANELGSFDVSIIPGTVAAPVVVHDVPSSTSMWSVRGLVPGAGYVGAVAASGDDWRVRLWQWISPPLLRAPAGCPGRSPIGSSNPPPAAGRRPSS